MSIAAGSEMAHVLVAAVTLAAVGASVSLHYEGLSMLSKRHRKRTGDLGRRQVLSGIFVMLLLHIVEIWIFGLAYSFCTLLPDSGSISMVGAEVDWLDRIYFSATSFTTLGYGDLLAHGAVRLLAGTEALVGLMLITWSASFTYLQMDRYWQEG